MWLGCTGYFPTNSQGVGGTACPTYHPQGGQSAHQQPEEVEKGMEVNVVGDEQDNAVSKEAIALEESQEGGQSGARSQLKHQDIHDPLAS